MLFPFILQDQSEYVEIPQSPIYNKAKGKYLLASAELKNGKYFSDQRLSKSNSLRERINFSRCVSILRNLHATGEVENIDELPMPKAILSFDDEDLRDLASKLKELYFPELK
jgi:hypothetical protein